MHLWNDIEYRLDIQYQETNVTNMPDDLSIHVIPGRVPDPRVAIDEAIEAERLGLKRVWLPERYSNKEAGVTLSAIAAKTDHIGVGTGPLTLGARPPLVTAAIGATLHSFYGPRFTLGVGRGDPTWARAHGMRQLSYRALVDTCRIIKQLWRGETVVYDGPAGKYDGIKLEDRPDGPIPKITMFHFGGPAASVAAADPVFDEVGFSIMLRPEAMRDSIAITAKECERIGRDPDAIHYIAPVASACELSDDDTLMLIAARIVIYLQVPEVGNTFMARNDWDPKVRDKICSHPLFADMKTKLADGSFHRHELLEVAKLVPDAWLHEVAAVGSVDECVKKLRDFQATGCAEIDLYSSSPAQNRSLIEAWGK